MSDNSPTNAVLKTLKENRDVNGPHIKRIIFSDDFYEVLLEDHFESKDPNKQDSFNVFKFGDVCFTVSETLQNRWALVMSDGTLQFSNDEKST